MLERIKEAYNAFRSIPQSQPPSSEVAVTDSLLYAQLGLTKYNPDTLVRNKGGLNTYDQMRLDDEVKSALNLKKQAVLSSGYTIEPASEERQDVEIAEFVDYSFNHMVGSVNDKIEQILTALDYGYSITEILWMVYDEGPHTGMIGLKTLKPKRPHNYVFDMDEYSNILPDGLIQRNIGIEERYPINKFIIYSYQKEFGNPYGRSDLRSAYRSWWSKDNIIKFWNIYLERHGMPLVWGKHSTSDSTIINNFKTMLKNLQSKTSIVSNKTDFEIDLIEAKSKGKTEYEMALSYHNKAIARSILIPDKLSESGEKGAYAMAKVHFDVFLWVVQKLRRDVEEIVMQEQVIRRLVGWNYQNVDELPKFRFNAITDEQKQGLAKLFIEAVSKGAIIPTFDDENELRGRLSFPEVEQIEVDKRTKPVKGEDDEETGEGQKAMSYAKRKTLTKYEKRVNYVEIQDTQEDIQESTLEAMQETLKKQMDKLTGFVASKMSKGELTSKMINTGIDLAFANELKAEFNKMYNDTYKEGIQDSKAELSIAKVFIRQTGMELPPTKALEYFNTKANFYIKGLKDRLTNETHRVLLEALRLGWSTSKTVSELQKLYAPYLATGEITVGDKLLQPYRLEAIIRTEMSAAYNYGRRAMAEDPEVADEIIGYQFSEILDDRTTIISRFVDGKIINKDNPSIGELTYPLHWNERGLFVFVTKNDLPVTFMSEGEVAQAVTMKGI